MSKSKPKIKPALARITFLWYCVVFFTSYSIVTPSSILGYIGFFVLGFFLSNSLPAIVAGILNKLGINPSILTNIGRYNEAIPFQYSKEDREAFEDQKYGL